MSLHQGPDLAQVPEKMGTGFPIRTCAKSSIWSASRFDLIGCALEVAEHGRGLLAKCREGADQSERDGRRNRAGGGQ